MNVAKYIEDGEWCMVSYEEKLALRTQFRKLQTNSESLCCVQNYVQKEEEERCYSV